MAATFNPFPRLSCRYGAPMGRHGAPLDHFSDWDDRPLYVRHCGGDGFYDRGGAYWGHSDVWAVYPADGELCAYIEAGTVAGAMAQVRSVAPDADIRHAAGPLRLQASA